MNLTKKLVAEFIGTVVLVIFGCASALGSDMGVAFVVGGLALE